MSAVDPMARLLHELDTPLGVALTAASMQEPALKALAARVAALGPDAELAALLHRLGESGQLVRSTLDRAIAIAGSHKAGRRAQAMAGEALDLGTILADALKVPLARFGERIAECRLNAAEDLRVRTEPNAWYQVIANLVSNSVLHGFVGCHDGGSIELSAWRAAPERVRVVYRDNGCGLSAHAREQAFKRRYSSRFGAGSSGLGLCIVAEIVRERLHGRIELLQGSGCAFAIDIPFTPPTTA